MRSTPIAASAGPGAWLINGDEVYRFGEKDDPKDALMQHLHRLGAAILLWNGRTSTLRYMAEWCSAESLETAVRHTLYPIRFMDLSATTPNKQAADIRHALAVCEDILMYRRLALPDHTVIIDRPPEQIDVAGTLLQSTLQAWHGNNEPRRSELVEIVQTETGFQLGDVGLDSPAARFHGSDWARACKGSPCLPEDANEFERALPAGYRRAIRRMEPVLQDVHARVWENGEIRRESYRRLLTPSRLDTGGIVVLVASEVLRDVPVPRELAE